MKASLLLFGLFVALAAQSRAYGQYIYIDASGDGLCGVDEFIVSSQSSIDVWLDSNHNYDGSQATCSDGVSPLDVVSFDIILHVAGSGTATFNSFDGTPEGFTVLHAFTTEGSNMSVGYVGTSYIGPGLIKLGTIHITATGNPAVSFLTSPPSLSFPSPATGFGSHCAGANGANFMALGVDFFDSCGTVSVSHYDSVESTTWGKVKQIYR